MHLAFTHRLVMMDVTSTRIPFAALAAWTSLLVLISASVGSVLPVIQSQRSSRYTIVQRTTASSRPVTTTTSTDAVGSRMAPSIMRRCMTIISSILDTVAIDRSAQYSRSGSFSNFLYLLLGSIALSISSFRAFLHLNFKQRRGASSRAEGFTSSQEL